MKEVHILPEYGNFKRSFFVGQGIQSFFFKKNKWTQATSLKDYGNRKRKDSIGSSYQRISCILSNATSPFFLENCADKGWSKSAISLFKIVGPCLISLSSDGDDLSASLFELPQLYIVGEGLKLLINQGYSSTYTCIGTV